MSNLGASIGWGLVGGGFLVAAVAFELAPRPRRVPGSRRSGLLAGSLVFVGADAMLTRDPEMMDMRRATHAAAAGRPCMRTQPAAGHRGQTRCVGIAESIALGLTIAEGEIGLALLVGVVVGNGVEAYGAAQPIVAGGHARRFAVALVGGIGLALALATVLGFVAGHLLS